MLVAASTFGESGSASNSEEMATTIASELDETVIPPPLDASCSSALELHSITEAGGKAYFELLSTWKTCLFGSKTPPDDDLSTATPAQLASSRALRVEAVLNLVAEAQARRVLDGRRASSAADANPAAARATAALGRQQGALSSCCAALGIARPARGEAALETVARLREAAAAAASPAGSSSQSAPSAAAARPLLTASSLMEAELATLEKVAAVLTSEYETRRAMLLKRLDVLISTFRCSSRLEGDDERKAEMLSSVGKLIEGLPPPARLRAADAFKADASLLELQLPVRIGARGTGADGGSAAASAVKKVLIGKVPDRGGRTGEAYAPMQSFTQQQREREGRGGGGGGGGGGGKGRGGGGGGKGSRGRGRR